jgi:hypothetical protein
MAQAVSHPPVNTEAWFATGSIHVVFVVDTVAQEQVYLRVLRFPLFNINPPWLCILSGG